MAKDTNLASELMRWALPLKFIYRCGTDEPVYSHSDTVLMWIGHGIVYGVFVCLIWLLKLPQKLTQ